MQPSSPTDPDPADSVPAQPIAPDAVPPETAAPDRPPLWITGLLAVAALKLAVHLAAADRFGVFIDELYYVACSQRLDLGYVDHPPVIAYVTWIVRALFGEWLPGLRLPSSLAGAATVALGGAIARELGGGRFAQLTAAVALAISPLLLFHHHVLSMNSLDVLLAAVASWILVRIGRLHVAGAHGVREWIALGVVLGIGLETKLTPLFWGAGLGVGLLTTSVGRQMLRTRGPYLAAGISFLLFLPYLVWQQMHGWPTLEFMRNATEIKNRSLEPLEFMVGHVLEVHPLAVLLLLAGLLFLTVHPQARAQRVVAWIYPVAVAIFLWRDGKTYYLGPFIAPLLAAGAVWLELGTRRLDRSRRPVQAVVVVALLVGGAATAPFTLPILPVERTVAYLEASGISTESPENKEVGPLPQHFADMFGHRELAEAVATVHERVAPTTDRPVAIYGDSYAQAGAVDFFAHLDLPPALSGHNSYWLWGPTPEARAADTWILISNTTRDALLELFEEVELATRVSHPYAMPWRDDYPIWVARGPKGPIDELWPSLKNFQ